MKDCFCDKCRAMSQNSGHCPPTRWSSKRSNRKHNLCGSMQNICNVKPERKNLCKVNLCDPSPKTDFHHDKCAPCKGHEPCDHRAVMGTQQDSKPCDHRAIMTAQQRNSCNICSR